MVLGMVTASDIKVRHLYEMTSGADGKDVNVISANHNCSRQYFDFFFFFGSFKGSIFLKNRHFIFKKRFNKYGNNTSIKCGI